MELGHPVEVVPLVEVGVVGPVAVGLQVVAGAQAVEEVVVEIMEEVEGGIVEGVVVDAEEGVAAAAEVVVSPSRSGGTTTS